MERGKRQALSSFFGGTGFYIALLLCVLAVGVGGFYWMFGGSDGEGEADPVSAGEADQRENMPPVAVSGDGESQPVQRPVTVIMPEKEEFPPEQPAVQTGEESRAERVVSPVAGETVTVFSPDALQYNETTDDWRVHDGVDIRAAAGTAVVAASAGTVLSVGQDDRLGVTVVIGHAGGYETTYAGLLERTVVAEGDSVSAGDPVGSVGNTTLTESALGAHLHFSVTKDGEPVDPQAYLRGE